MMFKSLCNTLGLAVIFVCLFQGTYGRSVCYEPLGCFYRRNGWLESWEVLPDGPESIKTNFTFFVNNHSFIVETLRPESYNFSIFDPDLETVILLNGDPEYSSDGWALGKLNDLRTNEDLNIIMVDWNVKGANSWYYDTSVANLRVVGAQIGLLLQDLRLVYNISMDTVRIIGDSLQGHVARYSWTDIQDIETINGFQPEVNMTSDDMFTDAIIVEMIEPDSSFGVCFGLLGCFPRRYAGETLPEHPRLLQTKFLFYTRGYEEHVLHAIDIDQEGFILPSGVFNKTQETMILIHGLWESSGYEDSWIGPMVKELHKQKPYNVIVVDWEKGADSWLKEGIANTRVVGAQLALLLKVYGIEPGTIHIIGYSLGTHVAGYAGATIKGIGRITGLDAAGWWFETAHSFASLDPTDALFVDVIHTDSNPVYGFGMRRPVGMVDYYVNGGMDQPGCRQSSVWIRAYGVINGYTICSHKRSIELFTESINSDRCHFIGYPCDDVDNLDNCTTCNGGCVRMGFHLDLDNIPAGIYHVSTRAEKPYCSNSEAKHEGLISDSINDIPS